MNVREKISQDELRRLYLDEHRTTTEIAKHFQCGESTIRRRMEELGIEARSRGPVLGAKHNYQYVNPTWSAPLAYAVGMIATDGNLSPDGRHLSIRSADYDLLETIQRCLELENRIVSMRTLLSTYYSLQWGDRAFYLWLESIGMMPAKSLVLGALAVPDAFFPDFLRGVIDGDGCIRIYQDRWNTFKNPKYVYERVYITIASASSPFLEWIQSQTIRLLGIKGALVARGQRPNRSPAWELKYAKKDSLVLFEWIYYDPAVPALARKKHWQCRHLGPETVDICLFRAIVFTFLPRWRNGRRD